MADNQVVVRLGTVEDAEHVAALAMQLGYPTTEEDMQRCLAQVERDRGHVVYVAAQDGRGVGWIHVCVRPVVVVDQAAEIEGLVVDEAHRGYGIGRLLIQQAEQWMRERDCHTAYVRSNIVRERAHSFYKELGYENIKTSLTFRKTLRDDG